MNGANKIFLLPCEGCACDLEIVAGQAGGHAACPACGRRNDVPKFRDLASLRIKLQTKNDAGGGGRSGWSAAQAVAWAGLACAVLSWGAAWFIGSTPESAIDVEQTKALIEAGDDAALYRSLQDYENAPVERPPLRVEFDLQRRTRFAKGMSGALYGLGGLGAAAAVAAGVVQLLRKKRA